MAITISNVTLRPGLVWTDRWGSQKVSQRMIRTLGGLPVFYHARLHSAVKVTLESLPDQGWQTLATVQALQELASVSGAQYLLDLGVAQFSVMFRHEDAPAFEANPLTPRIDVGTNGVEDYFLISMKLITV